MKNNLIKKDFEQAIKNREFKIYLQPKFDSQTEKLVGAEALVRRQKQNQIIFPDDFIPLYEEINIVTKLDLYVLEEVCKTLQEWQEQNHFLFISVNESPKHLSNELHGKELINILNQYGVSPSSIELEVTEGAVIQDIEVAKKAQSRVHSLGFTTAMDDFGVGYSSFSMLKNIPIDVLKIDKSFLKDLLQKKRDQIILESVIDMAHKLKIKTVMEGVETKEEVEYLREIGCDILQGYYFSKPIPVNEFEEKYL